MERERDPVVREISVCICDELADKLALLQFPLRPCRMDKLSEVSDLAAKIKPQNRVLELSTPLDTKSEHYDRHADVNIKTKQQLLRGAACPPQSNYAVGVFHEGTLYLTPLAETLQLRPSLDHVKERRISDAYDSDDEENDEDDEDQERGMKTDAKPSGPALTEVQYRKKESDRVLAQHRRSFTFHRNQLEAEPWVPLEVAGTMTETSSEAFGGLYGPLLDEEAGVDVKSLTESRPHAVREYLAQLQYMDGNVHTRPQRSGIGLGLGLGLDVATRNAQRALGIANSFPAEDDMDVQAEAQPMEELSLKTLAFFQDLDIQVFSILRVSKIVTLPDVLRILERTFTTALSHGEFANLVVDVLKQFGILISGRWILKTELVEWSSLKKSQIAGTEVSQDSEDGSSVARNLERCRDIALLYVHKNRFVDKEALMKTTKLTWRQVEEVLTPWARVDPIDRVWILKLDESQSTGSNSSFGMKDHPIVVQEMNRFLSLQMETFKNDLQTLDRYTKELLRK